MKFGYNRPVVSEEKLFEIVDGLRSLPILEAPPEPSAQVR